MSIFSQKSLRAASLAGLALLAGAAQAHTGHGTSTLMDGLAHPLGLDHLLAMFAVGVWSVSALPQGKAWQGPATFLVALILSAVLGSMGMTVPYLEHAISLSVLLFGVMLIAARQTMPSPVSLGLVALAASLHGLAHGAEAPVGSFGVYALGFVLTTSVLHMSGVSVALTIQRTLTRRANWALGSLGAGVGAAGVYLLGQVAA